MKNPFQQIMNGDAARQGPPTREQAMRAGQRMVTVEAPADDCESFDPAPGGLLGQQYQILISYREDGGTQDLCQGKVVLWCHEYCQQTHQVTDFQAL